MREETKPGEFVRVRRDEWDGLRKDIELFIQHHQTSLEKVRDLTKENDNLKERLGAAVQRLTMVEREASADIQQTSKVLEKMRASISHALQQTEK